MREFEKAYLAGIVDARGSITVRRNLRIMIRQRVLNIILPMLRELGPGGFVSTQTNAAGIFVTRNKRYKIGPRRVVVYEFGVRKTGAILETLAPYLRRDLWKERRQRDAHRKSK